MKVKISYNIELDDVPDHVSELLENVSDRLKKIALQTNDTSTKIKSRQFSASTLAQTFTALRGDLEKVDVLLGDFGAILSGYEQAKLTPETIPGYSAAEHAPEEHAEMEVE
tara:strand:+ start:1516 stop:1848 length:333 start_codon:yes stop_codon:yes gene_type:complete